MTDKLKEHKREDLLYFAPPRHDSFLKYMVGKVSSGNQISLIYAWRAALGALDQNHAFSVRGKIGVCCAQVYILEKYWRKLVKVQEEVQVR